MATYNTPFLMAKRALDSVLNQDFQGFEILIIDDGSDLKNGNLLLEYALKHENKISYIRHKNVGQSNAINKGILFCKTKYISIIDADDEYKTNHLSTCLLSMNDFDLVATHTETVVNNFEDYYVPNKYNFNKNIHVDECILFATLFGKKEVFETIDFKNNYGADSDFYDQASKYFCVIKLKQRTYIYYRNHFHSITANLKQKQFS